MTIKIPSTHIPCIIAQNYTTKQACFKIAHNFPTNQLKIYYNLLVTENIKVQTRKTYRALHTHIHFHREYSIKTNQAMLIPYIWKKPKNKERKFKEKKEVEWTK